MLVEVGDADVVPFFLFFRFFTVSLFLPFFGFLRLGTDRFVGDRGDKFCWLADWSDWRCIWQLILLHLYFFDTFHTACVAFLQLQLQMDLPKLPADGSW